MAYQINDIIKLDVGEINTTLRCTENGIYIVRKEIYSQDTKTTDIFINKPQIRYIYLNGDHRGSGLMINDRFFRLKEPKECLRLIVGVLFDKNNCRKLMIQTSLRQADGSVTPAPIYVWNKGIYSGDKFMVCDYITSLETGEGVVKIFMPTNLSSHKQLDLMVPEPHAILVHITNALYENADGGDGDSTPTF